MSLQPGTVTPCKNKPESSEEEESGFFRVSPIYWPQLLEGDEAGGAGGTHTTLAVLQGLVGNGERTRVAADCSRFDFHLVEGLDVVNAHYVPYHLRQEARVSLVGLYHFWLPLMGGASFLAFLRLLSSEPCFHHRPWFRLHLWGLRQLFTNSPAVGALLLPSWRLLGKGDPIFQCRATD